MLVQSGVDGGTPNGGFVFGESLADMLNALWRCDNASHVYALGRALGKESLISQFHRTTRCQHRVGYNQVLTLDARRGQILNMYAHLGVLLVNILAISRHKGVACVVEDIQEPIVKGQSGAENGGQHNLIRGHLHACNAQGRSDVACLIV